MNKRNSERIKVYVVIVLALCCGYATSEMLNSVLIKRRHTKKISKILDLTEVPLGLYEIRRKSNSVFMTKRLRDLFQISEEEEDRLKSDKEEFQKRLQEICSHPSENPQIFCIPCQKGERYVKITQKETKDAVLGVVLDATEEVLQTENLKIERDKDSLTGIRNRNAFHRMMTCCNNQNMEGKKIGIAMFDLNELKMVNDTWGHNQGDAYIKKCSKIICTTFSNCAVFRIGGDEFAAIFTDVGNEEMDKLHEILKEKMDEWKQTIDFDAGISFGYAIYNKNWDRNLEDVLKRADCLMYQDKLQIKERMLLE